MSDIEDDDPKRGKRYWRNRALAAELSVKGTSHLILFMLLAFYVWLFRDELVSLLGKLPAAGTHA